MQSQAATYISYKNKKLPIGVSPFPPDFDKLFAGDPGKEENSQ